MSFYPLRDHELEAARKKIADLETALTAARRAADVEARAARLARDSAATAWRLSFPAVKTNTDGAE